MNTLDLYIDYLKSEKEKALESGISDWILAASNELTRALGFAQSKDLTKRHRTQAAQEARARLAEAKAKELWIEQNADDALWAEKVWPEMTSPDDWSQHALELLEEACTILDVEESTNG